LQYPTVHPYPTSVSSHSSPASNQGVPSPRQATNDNLPPTSPKMASPTFGMAQVHVPSPPRPFDFPFAMGQSHQPNTHNISQSVQTPLSAVTPEGWSEVRGQPTDPNNLLYFPGSSTQDSANGFFYNNQGQTPTAATFEPSFYYEQDGLNGLTVQSGSNGASSNTPPYANFPTPGLPFAGLDYIRNYNPDGFSGADDSLWQSIDPGAFHYESDLPWALNELPVVEEGHERQE
jgi:hypothetical protein